MSAADEKSTVTGRLERPFLRNPAVEEAPLQGEVMLFHPASTNFYVLNRTMAFLWRGCDGTRTPASLLVELDREFSGVDPEVARADFVKALDDLIALDLVVEA